MIARQAASRPARDWALELPYAYIVADAPAYWRGGSTLTVQPVSPAVVNAPALYPSPHPPAWHVVPEEHPVEAWRLVDVEDVLCGCRQGSCTASDQERSCESDPLKPRTLTP